MMILMMTLLTGMTGCNMAKYKRMTDLEKYGISRKVVKLKREGYPHDQAVAIAFRMWRDGELNIPPTPDQTRKKRQQENAKARKKRRLDYRKRQRLRDR